MNILTQRVPRSVIGLILFGGVVLPYSLYQQADSLSKMRLANAWPYPWKYCRKKAENSNSTSHVVTNNDEWIRTEGIPLKVDVVQLEEQCFAPFIIYGYKVPEKKDTFFVNDSLGLKPHHFSFTLGHTLQDPFPFHFLSQGNAMKFITSLFSNTKSVETPQVPFNVHSTHARNFLHFQFHC
jgi:hypothetical protein